MLSKILVTLAVIIGAFFVLRQRQVAEANQAARKDPARRQEPVAPPVQADDNLAKDLRIGAYLFLVLMVGLGAALYYFQWQDDHTIVTVNLHRDNLAEPVRYQVYKYQLQDRSFITVDGTSVNVAASERMEILGLD